MRTRLAGSPSSVRMAILLAASELVDVLGIQYPRICILKTLHFSQLYFVLYVIHIIYTMNEISGGQFYRQVFETFGRIYAKLYFTILIISLFQHNHNLK